MIVGERIEVLTINLELVSRDFESLRETSRQDGENIRVLLARLEDQRES